MSKMIARHLVFAATATMGVAALSVALANGRSTKDGVFTDEQASRGKSVYETACMTCHPTADFYRERLARYENRTGAALFESISTSMPADRPGDLMTSEYLDVISYILSITGSPAGAEELTTDNMEGATVGPVN